MRRVLTAILVLTGCAAPARIETSRPSPKVEVVAAPAPPPTISLHGSRIALGGLDDEPLEATLLVEGDRRVALELAIRCPEGVVVEPASITIPAGRSVALELRVAAGASVTGELVFEARTRDKGTVVALRPLPISVERHGAAHPVAAPVAAPAALVREPAPEPRLAETVAPESSAPETPLIVSEVEKPLPEAPPVVEAAPVPSAQDTGAAVAPRSVEKPAPATAAPNRTTRLVGDALIALASLGALGILALVLRSRALDRRFGRKQVRAIGSNRRLSYERYLLRERRTGARTALAPDGPLALALEVQDDSVLVTPLEGSEVFGSDGRAVAAATRLEHGDLLRVVRGAFERRFVYLAHDPTGDELVKTWGPRALPSDEGALDDEDLFVILEERQELVAPSARLGPLDLGEPLGLDSDEAVVLTDSQEELLLDP
jgi:hypothetical protein